jgi:phosphatidylinositol-3,4,5-trisphosphate 3-phosphatase/dual-specificity protein phosphatase PTEN
MAQLLQNYVKALVSKEKNRLREDGFDLDLTYVAPRIIAMGFPATSLEGRYRNRIGDVERFLELRHGSHYRVYNLCAERTYPLHRFGGRFERFPFDDHAPPPLGLLHAFCASVDAYLMEDAQNVVAVHCKAGKGRTGVAIASYFLYARLHTTPAEALAAYGAARTRNGEGVTIPSQRRFVAYFGRCCEWRGAPHRCEDEDAGKVKGLCPARACAPLLDAAWNARWRAAPGACPPPPRRVRALVEVRCHGLGAASVDITCGDALYPCVAGRLTRKVPLAEEVRVAVRGRKGVGFWFHCSFVDTNVLRIDKAGLDRAHKDKGVPAGAAIELIFGPLTTTPGGGPGVGAGGPDTR